MPTKAELESALSESQSELEKTTKALEDLKRKVYDKVQEMRTDNEWCDSGVDQALEELGIKPPVKEYRAVVTLVVEADITVENWHEPQDALVDYLTGDFNTEAIRDMFRGGINEMFNDTDIVPEEKFSYVMVTGVELNER